MKTTLAITTLLLGLAPLTFAAKSNKKDRVRPDNEALHAAIEALKPFDKNGNKTIDGEELAEVNKVFAAAPSGPLAVLDKNKDGKLDAAELKVLEARRAIGAIVKELDKDGNHKLEGPEIEALKKKFDADPKGALAVLDRNSDGKLDDEEVKLLTERIAKRAEGAAPKRKGKKPVETSTPAKPAAPAEAPKPKDGEEVKKAEPTTK
jgi:Ca2+-binding EF-hand superfamily protein